jgi:hypothetical protein
MKLKRRSARLMALGVVLWAWGFGSLPARGDPPANHVGVGWGWNIGGATFPFFFYERRVSTRWYLHSAVARIETPDETFYVFPVGFVYYSPSITKVAYSTTAEIGLGLFLPVGIEASNHTELVAPVAPFPYLFVGLRGQGAWWFIGAKVYLFPPGAALNMGLRL